MHVQRQLAPEEVRDVALHHYLNFARRQVRLTLGQESKLLARSISGERQATEALVNSNQALVVAVSETYENDRLSFMDRAAEGNVALISACRRYQPGLDGLFRGFCLLKIRKAIEHALAEVAGFRVVRQESGWSLPGASKDQDNLIEGTM